MKLLGLLLATATMLAAQTGIYHYARLTLTGANFASPSMATNGGTGEIAGQLAGLDVRTNGDASFLIGSSARLPIGPQPQFELLAAVRPAATNIGPVGLYSGAYFGSKGGAGEGFTTAFLNFSVDASGVWSNVLITGHTAARDDVNRDEQPSGITQSVSGGTGVVRFPPNAELITGDLELMVSADGAWLLGYSRNPSQPGILIAHRRAAERAASLLTGLYQIAEVTAEAPFAFDPARIRLSSSLGTLSADGQARAEIAALTLREPVRLVPCDTGRVCAGPFPFRVDKTWLTTANTFSVDTATGRAALVAAPGMERGRNNFHFSPDGLVGAQVGPPGEVTLEHGILVGVKLFTKGGSGVVIAEFGVLNAAGWLPGPVSTLGYFTIFGLNFAQAPASAPSFPLPLELGGTRVLVNGQPAPVSFVSPGQINFQFPAVTGATARVQVSSTAGLSNEVTATIDDSSPGLLRGLVLHANFNPVTQLNPARPGETVLIYALGLGAVSPRVEPGAAAAASPLSRTIDPNLRVYVAGLPAGVEFSGLAPGFAGLYQLNIRVPDDALDSLAAPLAISLGSAFTDLAEIAIAR